MLGGFPQQFAFQQPIQYILIPPPVMQQPMFFAPPPQFQQPMFFAPPQPFAPQQQFGFQPQQQSFGNINTGGIFGGGTNSSQGTFINGGFPPISTGLPNRYSPNPLSGAFNTLPGHLGNEPNLAFAALDLGWGVNLRSPSSNADLWASFGL